MKRLLLLRGAELALLAVLAAIPFGVANSYALGLLTLLAIYGILLIGLDVTVGYLGQVNLAQAAFLGLGGYAAALAVAQLGAGIPLALAIALGVGVVLGGLLAFPALRLEGPQFALATLSFSALATTCLNELESLTGGAQGLSVIRPPLFGTVLDAPHFYWLCLAILALVWLALRNLLDSHWGRAFEALRDSPIATDAMGIGTYRHKVAGFAIGSGLGGLAGGLYAFNFQYLQPQSFTYELMVILLLGVVLGGRKSLWGAFVGAAFIVLLPNLLSNRVLFQEFSALGLALALAAAVRGLKRHRTATFQAMAPVAAMGLLVAGGLLVENTEDWRRAIFALMLFAVVVGLPEGLMGFVARGLGRLVSLPAEPLPRASPLERVLPLPGAATGTLLVLRNLKRHFGGVRAVDGIDLVLQRGSIHGLIGPNGSGKSTAVNVISGLYAPTDGSMTLSGRPLPQGSLMAAARAGIARTFQNLQLFSELTALENVMMAMTGAYRTPLPLVLLGFNAAEERQVRADALVILDLVGLGYAARVRARDLPHGDQRFLEIARALARKPELLILDEPAAGLAHPDSARLVKVIRTIKEHGFSMILIEHHMDVVSELCDTVTVLDGGRVICSGAPAEIRRDPKVIAAYLGAGAVVPEGAC